MKYQVSLFVLFLLPIKSTALEISRNASVTPLVDTQSLNMSSRSTILPSVFSDTHIPVTTDDEK